MLFEALGYTNIGNGLLVLDGPVCVDRAMAVSKDCLVAYVECQVIIFILLLSNFLEKIKFWRCSKNLCNLSSIKKNIIEKTQFI